MVALLAQPFVALQGFFLLFLAVVQEFLLGLIEAFFVHVCDAFGEICLVLEIVVALFIVATL